jgi:hypothetical protein
MIWTLTKQLRRTIPENDRQTIAICLRMIWRYFPAGVSVKSLKELEMATRNLNLRELACQMLHDKNHKICMTNIIKYLHDIRPAAQSEGGWWWSWWW